MDSILFQADGLLSCLKLHLWNACIQGSLALLLVYAVCRLFPRIPPHAASWLWMLAYIKLLVALVFVGSVPLPMPVRANGTPAVAIINTVLASSGLNNLPAPKAHLGGTQIIVAVLVLLWYAGLVVSGIRVLSASRKTREMLRACIEVEDHDLRAELSLLCSRMGIRRAPCLLSGDIDGPLVSGFTAACIILPNRMLAGSTRAELRLALAHELAHIRRHDVAWAWLPMLASWFFFFHPLVWLLRREWMVAQEAACDLLAIETTGAACADYGRMLVNCAVQAGAARRFATVGIVESHETLKRRILAMATLRNASRTKQITVGIAIVVLAIVGVVPWMLGCSNRTEEIANALPRAAYAGNAAGFDWLNPSNTRSEHGSETARDAPFCATISSRVRSYGAVRSVRLEAKGKALPGLNAAMPGYSMSAPPAGLDVSTWRVSAEHGDYRLLLFERNGGVVGYVFNLADGGIGSGDMP